MLRRLFFSFLFLALSFSLFSQEEILPKGNSEAEEAMLQWIDFVEPATMGIAMTDPPPEPVRHMAEWEELEALVITWRSFPDVLREIVRHAKEEVRVIILVRNENVRDEATFELTSNGITLDNVEFLVLDNNSVWVRDYGQNTVYANDVEDRYFIDWVYNRIQRPEDDVTPEGVGDYLDTEVYSTTTGDYRMVHTGGNFMSDGLGTAFSSELIFEENEPGNVFGAGPHDEEAIDGIMNEFMGIDRYIKFETLPYDVIHHIDMHMHLTDEETILWAEYPEGVADGPQIEANIDYLRANYMSAFGTPYRIERIISPPDFNGTYPNQGGDIIRTYTNSVFVNGTILVPFYETQYDTIAQRIYEEHFPGYKVVGINCNGMIWALGALHCITKEVGSDDPLWIVHQRQRDIMDNNSWGDYPLSAQIKHAQGVSGATLYWTTNLDNGYEAITMTADPDLEDNWLADIPHQENGTTVYYYIHAEANNGKTQVRPLPAPEAYYPFTVNDMTISSTQEIGGTELHDIYPNPASAITVIPVEVPQSIWAKVDVVDITGKLMKNVFEGVLDAGENKLFIDAATYPAGTYLVSLTTEAGVASQKLVVK